MIHKKLNIWENYDGGIHTQADLTTYVIDNSPEIDLNRKHKAVLICPGGGYQGVSDREAEYIALEFAAAGFCAFVLRYSVSPHRYPTQLLEISRAMWLIRQNADEWHVNTHEIAVCGFSAGGHLAGHLATCWQQPFIAETLGMPQGMNKPNRLILCYPVISSCVPNFHEGSFQNLLGPGQESEYEQFSPDRLVCADTPPTFIWHTSTDPGVPVAGSLSFAMALTAFNIPFELHVYPLGEHGLSLCDSRTANTQNLIEPYAGKWMKNCVNWMNLDF